MLATAKEGEEAEKVSLYDETETGVRVPRKMPDPKLPTQAEVDEHSLTHVPYRNCCTHCVRGRWEAHPHWRCETEDRGMLEIHMVDYCIVENTDEQTQPILVMNDRDSAAVGSFLVQRKGNAGQYVECVIHRRWSSSRTKSRQSDL